MIACGAAATAQDLIIRIYGDTIRAKIDKEESRFIYYRTTETRRGETEIIARTEVREVFYDFDSSYGKRIGKKKIQKKYETFQLLVHAGYSFILREDDLYGDDFQTVYKEVREGAFIDARVNFFLSEEIGVGLLYSHSGYRTNTDIPISVTLPSTTVLTGELSHDRQLSYYAGNLAIRLLSSPNFNVQIDVGVGLLEFIDRATFINDYSLRSTALGGHISASFQLVLGEGFYLPAFVSIKGFNLSSFDLDPSPNMDSELVLGLEGIYGRLNTGISASRFQAGLGLGFAF